MVVKIALAGNPNCGKTTMFNELTGSAQYVGNWPGVTVEKKEGHLKGHKDVIIVDLPGVYSLSPYTLEEVVTRNFLLAATDGPDVILNIIDSTNLERNLYLTTQLLEMGLPVVVALNMTDLLQKNGEAIDEAKLAEALNCPVFETAAIRGRGLKEAVETCIALAGQKTQQAVITKFATPIEVALHKIEVLLCRQSTCSIAPEQLRWYCIKAFERDEKITQTLALLESVQAELEQLIQQCEASAEEDSESLITLGRYAAIEKIAQAAWQKRNQKETTSDKIDKILTNRVLALPIFAVIMWAIYYLSIQSVGELTTGWMETFFGWLGDMVASGLTTIGAADWLISLCVDGIIGGVGAVLGFVPQMMILFLLLSILEDCGYMARVAFIMDRLFRKFGLSGKSFIPMLVSTGCGVPGIMATRTIESEADRRLTIMVTTFIPCGAKLPIIGLIAGALFHDSSWVAPSMYFLGVAAVVISGLILKRTKLFAGDPAPFVLELPQYHLPSAKGLCIHVWERCKAFIIKAGTVIFVASGVIWFLSSFNWSLDMVSSSESILASIGRCIAPIFAPLGFGNWQATVATLTGLLAKENIVSSLGVLLGVGEAAEADPTLISSVSQLFSAAGAYAFMAFNLLCAPCVAAIGAIRREMGNWKWTLIAIGYQTGLAYVVAFLLYQIGSLLS